MRILHVTHQYYPAVGGAEQHITYQSEALAQRGHDVDVYTTRSTNYRTWRGTLPRFERVNGVNVYRFTSFARGPCTFKLLERGLEIYWRSRSKWSTPLIIWGNGPVSLGMMDRMLRDGRKYDLIHANSLHYALVSYTYWIARHLGVPYALTPFVHIHQPGVFDIEFQNVILHKAALVLAMTEVERDYLEAHAVARDRIVVCGSGINLDNYPRMTSEVCRQQLGLPRDAFVLLFLGRKESYKGLATLLAACAQLQSDCPNLYLVAAGTETDHSRQLRQRFASLKRVIYYERVSDHEKLALLNACDAFGMPSVGESFGIVYLEAWAVGKPVLGAQSGAVTSVVDDGVNGLLVNPVDAQDTAEKIKQLYHNHELCARLAASGYAKLQARYTVQSVCDVIEGAYLRTVRQHRNARHSAVCVIRG